jgi:hypothetical protein
MTKETKLEVILLSTIAVGCVIWYFTGMWIISLF